MEKSIWGKNQYVPQQTVRALLKENIGSDRPKEKREAGWKYSGEILLKTGHLISHKITNDFLSIK